MIRCITSAISLGVLVFTLTLLPADAEGCGSVGRPGDIIRIAEESAVIVWDSVNKVEHFTRRAAFDTKSADFGFLVPTPTQPILAEIKDRIFVEMDRWIKPKAVEKNKYKFEPISCLFGCGSKGAKGSPDGVRVLAEQQVGGFDTTVLEADNTDALGKWITEHGYSTDPELQSWLAPYVANKWKITAFKIIQDPTTGKLATTMPVRMSFKTDRPFFPYREPAVKDEKQLRGRRLLRVFFIGDMRMAGTLGNDAPWHARVAWADQLTDEQRAELVKETGVSDADIPANAWMTTFEDQASQRPGKDEVYFGPSQDRSPVRPTWIKFNEIWIPIDVMLFAAAFVCLVGISIRRWGWRRMLPVGPVDQPKSENGPLGPPWTGS